MNLSESRGSIKIDANQVLHEVSPLLFGLFLEDINFACEGGLNANLVNNHSFDGLYINPQEALAALMAGASTVNPVHDRLRYWQISGGTLESAQNDPAAPKSWYGRIASSGQARLENLGHNGGLEQAWCFAGNDQDGHGHDCGQRWATAHDSRYAAPFSPLGGTAVADFRSHNCLRQACAYVRGHRHG